MLTGTSDATFGEARIASALALEDRYRAQLIWRSGLLFDSSFLVPQKGARRLATLYLVHDGGVAVGPIEYAAPVGFAVAEREYERYETGAPSIRTWGDPSVALDLLVAAEDALVPIGLEHGPLAISDATWSAVSSLAEALSVAQPIEPPMLAILNGLALDGIVRRELARPPDAEPESLVRLWEALRPFYGRWDVSVELVELAERTAMSSRQLSRDAKVLNERFAHDGKSFREHIHLLRLRLAVLLLSARDTTIGEVAKLVAYGSLDAMGRAFRDAGLPPPHVVREAVMSP